MESEAVLSKTLSSVLSLFEARERALVSAMRTSVAANGSRSPTQENFLELERKIAHLQSELDKKTALCRKFEKKLLQTQGLLEASQATIGASASDSESNKASLLTRVLLLANSPARRPDDEVTALPSKLRKKKTSSVLFKSSEKDGSPELSEGRRRSSSVSDVFRRLVRRDGSTASVGNRIKEAEESEERAELSAALAEDSRSKTTDEGSGRSSFSQENFYIGSPAEQLLSAVPPSDRYGQAVESIIKIVREFDAKPPNPSDPRLFMERLEHTLLEVEAASTKPDGTSGNKSEQNIESQIKELEEFCFRTLYWRLMRPPLEVLTLDKLLFDRAQRLSTFLSLSHFDLDESIAMQTERVVDHAVRCLHDIDAMKSPADKLDALVRAARVVLECLKSDGGGGSSDGEKESLGADDFVPVFIFAVIMSKPHHLQSTIWFIESYSRQIVLRGERSYYFTQFVAAARFIEGVTAEKLSIEADVFNKNMSAFDFAGTKYGK